MANLFKFGGQGRNSIVYLKFSGYTNFRVVKERAFQAKTKNLRRAGAIVRGIMRRLIRPRKNPRLASPPGTPPFAHFLPGIKNTIEFDANANRVVIGPQINRSRPNISPVPGALEHGGTTLVRTFRRRNPKRRRQRNTKGQFRRHASRNGKPIPQWWLNKNPLPQATRVRAKIRPRPFAEPALKIFANSAQYAAIWRDCIR
jgi:hypothetical protein